jgi:hypothetical protein
MLPVTKLGGIFRAKTSKSFVGQNFVGGDALDSALRCTAARAVNLVNHYGKAVKFSHVLRGKDNSGGSIDNLRSFVRLNQDLIKLSAK